MNMTTARPTTPKAPKLAARIAGTVVAGVVAVGILAGCAGSGASTQPDFGPMPPFGLQSHPQRSMTSTEAMVEGMGEILHQLNTELEEFNRSMFDAGR